MSLGNWGASFLNDAAGGFFGSEYLRDYQHASKIFRSNSYQNTPKFKFLFHVYFDINPIAFRAFSGGREFTNVNEQTNFGVLVKEIKLPSYRFETTQLNQYNRRRIIQTKIKYDSVEINFHDDNGDTINSMWQAYYQYYYNDGTKPANNTRNIYNDSITGDDDWGFTGVSPDGSSVKQPFFKNIVIYGFNQHNFTSYTLVNPIITSFQHDQYNYNEGGGTMQNRMTVDYESVIYKYGALDGNSPENTVTGFGNPSSYDRTPSPIANPGSNSTILGQGGLIDASGGTININTDPVDIASTAYNAFKNPNLKETLQQEVLAGLMTGVSQSLNGTRNALFNFPALGSVPSSVNIAGSAVTGGLSSPPLITNEPVAGSQYNGTNLTTSYPPPSI